MTSLQDKEFPEIQRITLRLLEDSVPLRPVQVKNVAVREGFQLRYQIDSSACVFPDVAVASISSEKELREHQVVRALTRQIPVIKVKPYR